jgi:polyisoprenoid-binding protein YceI
MFRDKQGVFSSVQFERAGACGMFRSVNPGAVPPSLEIAMKSAAFALASALLATPAFAAPEKYTLDASHSQIVFSYDHLGFSTTYNMFSGINGEIMFDQEDPAASSVSVSFPVRTLFTGWEERFAHFMSPDLFNAADDTAMITFVSTGIEVTGENTANITGDVTMNGVTKPLTIATTMTKADMHPMANKPWVGFNGTATLLRSDFNLVLFAPNVGDEINIILSIEAAKAE